MSTTILPLDKFSGTTVPPQNWMEFSPVLGGTQDIAHKAGDVTLTDSTGNTTGILSTLLSNGFNPVGTNLVTTIDVNINGVSETPSLGNAIVGLVGVNQTGSLAAGIDGQGNVFLVWQQTNPPISEALKQIGNDKTYKGGATELTFLVEQGFVQVQNRKPGSKTPSFTSEKVTYSQLDAKFSLKDAFGGAATPALAGASQPGATGGVASFASITVSTG